MHFRSLFPEAIFHNEDKKASSLRIFCPCLYFTCLTNTFADTNIFRPLTTEPAEVIHRTLEHLLHCYKKSYPWSIGKGKDLPNAYVFPKKKKKKKAFTSRTPIRSAF